jgi:osmotically-inducible protein OsmY
VDTVVPADRVRVTVDSGWVTLKGDVDWDYRRREIEKAIRPLMEVVAILGSTVHSWQERAAAQGVAWSSPGVQAVVNEITLD